MFDPTQDRRFREAALKSPGAPSIAGDQRLGRQETILNEAAARIRRHAGLPENAKHDRPLIVILSKFDTWSHLLRFTLPAEPWRGSLSSPIQALDVDCIHRASLELRELLLKLCPETVAAAESLATEVIYVPVSSLGDQIESIPETGKSGIRPGNINPFWVTVPFLYALNRVAPALIARGVRRSK